MSDAPRMDELRQELEALEETRSKWQPYAAYRDSGIDWLGEIPAHWRVTRMKDLATIYNGATPKSTVEEYWDGDIAWATPDDLGQLTGSVLVDTRRNLTNEGFANCGASIVPAGSIILSTRAPIGHIAIAGRSMCTNQGCRALVLTKGVDNRYLYYLLYSVRPVLQSLGQGATFLELSTSKLASVAVPALPLPEQHAIAAFLDRETAKIDDLIAKKEQLIALLQEQRSAIISHAVTKGLDPHAPMKDSGVEWLGEIPSHWEVKRLKHVSPRQSVGLVINPSTYVDDNGTVPFFFGSNISEGRISIEGVRYISEESNRALKQSRLNAGDLVVVRVGYPGVTAVVPAELHGSNCASMMIVRSSESFISSWLCYVMNSWIGKVNVDLVAYGAAQKQFNISHAVEFIYPVPAVEEQERIVEFLEDETGKLSESRKLKVA